MAERLLTPQVVAQLLGVSPVTLRQWAQQGWIQAHRTAGKHRRFSLQEVRRFAEERGIRLNTELVGPTRLLVVEDDRQLVNYLCALFDDFTGEVELRVAYDGFDAGRLIASWHPHAVLLDLMLPGIDGFDVCNRLKGDPATAPIKVVAMTGYHSPENVERALQAGAESCLAKPFRRAELLDALGLSERPMSQPEDPRR
jgi:excisionase family DNA binding protein